MNFIDFIHPVNLKEEKEKFFSQSNYHPQFVYDWSNASALIKKLPRLETIIQAVVSQDLELIVREAQYIFDTNLEDQYLIEAKKITGNRPEKIAPPKPKEITDQFNQAFRDLGLSEYRLEIVDKMGFNFRPSPSKKKIVMSAHTQFDFYSLDAYIKHELVHIIRAENGVFNQISNDKNYLPTEEGLAGYCQDFSGKNGEIALYQRASEYLVTQVGLTSSLKDMIDFLMSLGFSKELAWQRSARHKYGFQNTKMSGDIMKPAMYFHHQQQIKNLSNQEKIRLFVGKISKDSLAKYPKYSGRISAEALQKFYPWRNDI